MMYALCALVGAFLFGAGYWFGLKGPKVEVSIQEPKIERVDMPEDDGLSVLQQYANMLNYTGRAQK